MKNGFIITIVTFLAAINPALAQGSLAPPGAPASTMKTLAQLEPRTPISSVPFTISNAGSYYLTTNLTVSATNAITIATNGVSLDLDGFCISSTASSANGTAIQINGSLQNITIANGFIQSRVNDNGSGVYSGSGFGYGIFYSGGMPANVLVSHVSVVGCLYDGINLGVVFTSVVEDCSVLTAGGSGIISCSINKCVAIDCGTLAIEGYQVADCYGTSVNGLGIGANTMQNCTGYSGSGTAISTSTAFNCYGTSNTGTAISAYTALNCYGVGNTGTGIYAAKVASGCYGYSNSGTGISAFIANVCSGGTSSGVAFNVTHNINSF